MKVKNICLNGMGIALFVVLSMCLRVPVFENYYLCLGYIVMAIYCFSNTIYGTLVGVLGTIIYCFLINGLRGMPGWAIGNIFIGIALGIAFKSTRNIKNTLLKNIIISISIVISCAFGILVVKSLIEMFLYAQPFLLRIANNIYAFVADVVVLILSLPFCSILGPKLKVLFNN